MPKFVCIKSPANGDETLATELWMNLDLVTRFNDHVSQERWGPGMGYCEICFVDKSHVLIWNSATSVAQQIAEQTA